MIKTRLFFPLFLSSLLCMSCSMEDGLSPTERLAPRFTTSDYVVENNRIALVINKEDALKRGISETQYDQVSEMIFRLNDRIAEYLMEYEREHGSRSLPVYMAHGYLYATSYGGYDHAGPVQVGYGDSFTVVAEYSGSTYMYGGQHTLKVEWSGGNTEYNYGGNGTAQYYFNYEQGPVDLYYKYMPDIYADGQCLWFVFGYFTD